MATTTWMEPGGDATFDTQLWSTSGVPAVATDFVRGTHVKSMKFRAAQDDELIRSACVVDAGGRISVYIYLNALPTATAHLFKLKQTANGAVIVRVALTSTGVLQLLENSVQIGSNGTTLSTGKWYRLCLAWTVTSTTVNQFRLFKDAAPDISVSNATLSSVTMADAYFGNLTTDTTLDLRMSDFYIDNSTALTDTGNIGVTAKLPIANGTTNNFTTQIGSGGSGTGTGHSPQVNERPESLTNGWSMVGAGSAVTEEYTIQGKAVGDIDISGAAIVDFMGWVDTKSLVAETAQIIVAGTASNISITSTDDQYTKIAGSTTYPAGGTDIGMITSTTVTTVSLYECGIIVAYIIPPTSKITGARQAVNRGSTF